MHFGGLFGVTSLSLCEYQEEYVVRLEIWLEKFGKTERVDGDIFIQPRNLLLYIRDGTESF